MSDFKKRIVLSQRYDQIEGRNEYRDALDVQWAKLLESIEILPIILPSSIDRVDSYLKELNIDGVILSGGNDIGSSSCRDRVEERAVNFAKTYNLPVLGVCRGMQFLNHIENGTLVECEGHVSTEHALYGKWAKKNNLSKVNSYHNQAITKKTLSPSFRVLAETEDDVIEAFEHFKYPWLGIMWHPEREQPFSQPDLELIKQHFGL
jgi:putative glutamine amidotransferase